MASQSIKISELVEISSASQDDMLVVNDSDISTRKLTLSNLKSSLESLHANSEVNGDLAVKGDVYIWGELCLRNYCFPTNDGDPSQILTTDGLGQLFWIDRDSGPKGEKGDLGFKGDKGQAIKGEVGDKGDEGDKGMKGGEGRLVQSNWDEQNPIRIDYIRNKPDLDVYISAETDPTVPEFVKKIAAEQILYWDEAYSWGDHADAGYLSGQSDISELRNVAAGSAIENQVLTYNAATNLWIPRTMYMPNTLVFQSVIDCTTIDAPLNPGVGWMYIQSADGLALSSWTGLSNVQLGDKLAYGVNNQWYIVGNTATGVDTTAFSVEISPTPATRGDLQYNENDGIFTYYPVDTDRLMPININSLPTLPA